MRRFSPDARVCLLGFNGRELGALFILASMTLSLALIPTVRTASAQEGNVSGSLLTTISLGNGTEPTAIVYDPANGYVYLTARSQSVVYAISGESNSVVASVSIPRSALTGITTDPAGDYLYAASAGNISSNSAFTFPGTISVIKATPFSVVSNITQDLHQLGIAYDSSSGNLYMDGDHCVPPGESAYVIGPSSGTVIATIPLASKVAGCGSTTMLYDPVNQNVYASVWDGNVLEISGASSQVMANVSFGGSTGAMAFNPTSGDVYATGGPGILVLCGCSSGLTGQGIIGLVYLNGFFDGIAYDASNGDLYATNFLDGTVSVVAVGPASSESTTSNLTTYVTPGGAVQTNQGPETWLQPLLSISFLLVILGATGLTLAFRRRGVHGVQRPASEATSFPPPPPPDTVMVKCQFCGTEQTWKEACDRCGAPLPKPGVG